MKLKVRLVAVILGVAIAAWNWAEAQTQTLKGNWTLDVARSTVPTGEPPPKSSVMRVTVDDGKSFAWSQTTVGPDGKSGVVGFRGAFDGRSYTLTGGGGTLAFTRDSPTRFHDEGSDPAGAHWSETCTLAQDLKTLTCDGEQSGAQGTPEKYTDVWLRN
jgi:hypothetical protein